MGTVEEIEQALLCLSPTDFDAFRNWFVDFDAASWDRQMKDDVVAGRLDAFAEEAIKDLNSGRCKAF